MGTNGAERQREYLKRKRGAEVRRLLDVPVPTETDMRSLVHILLVVTNGDDSTSVFTSIVGEQRWQSYDRDLLWAVVQSEERRFKSRGRVK